MAEMEWVCPRCGSHEVSQSMDDETKEDGTYEWYCLTCDWHGSEAELDEEEVPR